MESSNQQYNALPPGFVFEGYRIEKVLGAGGFGITYRAIETTANQQVAIKEYLPRGIAMRGTDRVSLHPVSDGEEEDYLWGLGRFRQEADTLVGFHHPNIVQVHRYFEANGTAYIVMDYQEGHSLTEVLGQKQRLDDAAAWSMLTALLDGLEQVHGNGFLHRDIKPDNVYLRTDGTPVLLDFGAARQALKARSRSLTAIVTPGYAPFEQYLSSSDQGPWSDIYALAATLYRAIVGLPPPESLERINEDEMVPASEAMRGKYRPQLLAAIDVGLCVEARERPQNVAAWRAMLDGDVPVSVGKVKKRSAGSRASLSRAIAGAIAVLLLSAGGFWAWSTFRSEPADGGLSTTDAAIGAETNTQKNGAGPAEEMTVGDPTQREIPDTIVSGRNWIKDENGCAVWTDWPEPDLTVTWSGDCLNGKAEGKGTIKWFKNGVAGDRYSGEVRDGRLNGKGNYFWLKEGLRYNGKFENGKRHGQGVLMWLNGDQYVGSFRNDRREGQGNLLQTDGTRFLGMYRNDREWNGVFTYRDGSRTRVMNGRKLPN